MNVPQEKDEAKKPPVPDDTPPRLAACIIQRQALLHRLKKLVARLQPHPSNGG